MRKPRIVHIVESIFFDGDTTLEAWSTKGLAAKRADFLMSKYGDEPGGYLASATTLRVRGRKDVKAE